jgi:hypothetical protein
MVMWLLSQPDVDPNQRRADGVTSLLGQGFMECAQLVRDKWRAQRTPKKKQQQRSGFFKRFCRRKRTTKA